MITSGSKSAQMTGNVGLYLICYELARRGWNIMPTSRNARGIDILAYSQDGRRTITVQAKALSNAAPVPLGAGEKNLIAQVVIIARLVWTAQPEFFIATPAEICPLIHVGRKNGKTSYWLQPKAYERFRDRWDLVGDGGADSKATGCDQEVARTRRNRKLTRFLSERSKAGKTYSLDHVKSRLGIQ